MKPIISILIGASLTLAMPTATLVAADLTVGSATTPYGQTATLPITIFNDANNLSVASITLSQSTALSTPTVSPGPDQPNLAPGDVVLDPLGPSLYRITALAKSSPDMAAGAGRVIYLTYNTTGISDGVYAVTPTTAALCTNGLAREAIGLLTAGQLTILPADITPPISSITPLADNTIATDTVCLNFTASDSESGVATNELWVRTPTNPNFLSTGLSSPGNSGVFCYTFANGDGTYDFALKSTDLAANTQPAPIASQLALLVNTEQNTTFTQVASAADTTLVFPMTNDRDVTITLTGSTPGGTVSVLRVTSPTLPAYFRIPQQTVAEALVITQNGLGSFTAALQWPYDPTLAAGVTPVNQAFAFEGGPAPSAVYSCTVSAGIATISGIPSFSTWYLGNSTAVPVRIESFSVD